MTIHVREAILNIPFPPNQNDDSWLKESCPNSTSSRSLISVIVILEGLVKEKGPKVSDCVDVRDKLTDVASSKFSRPKRIIFAPFSINESWFLLPKLAIATYPVQFYRCPQTHNPQSPVIQKEEGISKDLLLGMSVGRLWIPWNCQLLYMSFTLIYPIFVQVSVNEGRIVKQSTPTVNDSRPRLLVRINCFREMNERWPIEMDVRLSPTHHCNYIL